MPGLIAIGAAFVRFVVIPTTILIVGQDAWNDYTYEDRVETCIEQVQKLTTNEEVLNEAEVNCRRTLK